MEAMECKRRAHVPLKHKVMHVGLMCLPTLKSDALRAHMCSDTQNECSWHSHGLTVKLMHVALMHVHANIKVTHVGLIWLPTINMS